MLEAIAACFETGWLTPRGCSHDGPQDREFGNGSWVENDKDGFGEGSREDWRMLPAGGKQTGKQGGVGV